MYCAWSFMVGNQLASHEGQNVLGRSGGKHTYGVHCLLLLCVPPQVVRLHLSYQASYKDLLQVYWRHITSTPSII